MNIARTSKAKCLFWDWPVCINKGFSSSRALVSRQHFKGGRLAGSIHSQQPETLAGPNPETQPVHGQDPTHLARLIHLWHTRKLDRVHRQFRPVKALLALFIHLKVVDQTEDKPLSGCRFSACRCRRLHAALGASRRPHPRRRHQWVGCWPASSCTHWIQLRDHFSEGFFFGRFENKWLNVFIREGHLSMMD